MEKNICVLIEHENDEVIEPSLEVLLEARRLADMGGYAVTALLLTGSDAGPLCKGLGRYGAGKVCIMEHHLLIDYTTDGYAKCITGFLSKNHTDIFLLAGTSLGKDLAPFLSAKLETGLVSDCTVLDINENGILEMTRPTYGGRVYTTYRYRPDELQIATTRPGVFGIGSVQIDRDIEIEKMDVDISTDDIRTRVLGYSKVDPETLDITEAETVVAFGKGLGYSARLPEIKSLVKLIDASIAGSRVSVDEGWIHFNRQIGQTGKTISPDFLICFGISGATQFTMGMQDSRFIVAVNKDPYAPIFKVADVSVSGDMHEIIPILTGKLEKVKEKYLKKHDEV
ncbi:MAG: electron transfer flavoprotein subunit alpha/FixB family protein [Desulfobacterales bacterium]|jgi:electron transfer flavoprotein alpha subunit|nr:electron transfer flavoprotein subunit alpha/FixB family protein [Desulfobacterales bacterium]